MAVTTLNTSPIFTETPRISGVRVALAQTNSQGIGTVGTDYFVAFSAGADGSYLQRTRFSLTSAANVSSTASVIRLYVSTASAGAATTLNTWLIQEVTAASQTPNVVTTLTGATYPIDIPLNFAIPTGYNLLVGISATTVSANAPTWIATTYGGDY